MTSILAATAVGAGLLWGASKLTQNREPRTRKNGAARQVAPRALRQVLAANAARREPEGSANAARANAARANAAAKAARARAENAARANAAANAARREAANAARANAARAKAARARAENEAFSVEVAEEGTFDIGMDVVFLHDEVLMTGTISQIDEINKKYIINIGGQTYSVVSDSILGIKADELNRYGYIEVHGGVYACYNTSDTLNYMTKNDFIRWPFVENTEVKYYTPIYDIGEIYNEIYEKEIQIYNEFEKEKSGNPIEINKKVVTLYDLTDKENEYEFKIGTIKNVNENFYLIEYDEGKKYWVHIAYIIGVPHDNPRQGDIVLYEHDGKIYKGNVTINGDEITINGQTVSKGNIYIPSVSRFSESDSETESDSGSETEVDEETSLEVANAPRANTAAAAAAQRAQAARANEVKRREEKKAAQKIIVANAAKARLAAAKPKPTSEQINTELENRRKITRELEKIIEDEISNLKTKKSTQLKNAQRKLKEYKELAVTKPLSEKLNFNV